MKKFFGLSRFITISILFSAFFISIITPTPINNRYDPFAIYNVFGTDKFYTKKDDFQMRIQLSPFYQHASGARDKDGKKVREGDMLGRWNMLGLFFGDGASPVSKRFSFDPNTGIPAANVTDNYPYLSRSRRVLDGLIEGQPDNATVVWRNGITIPNPGNPSSPSNDANNRDINKNYADSTLFDKNNKEDGFFSIPLDYEKMGVRAQINFEFGWGFAIRVKTGIVDYTHSTTHCNRFDDLTSSGDATTGVGRARNYINEYLMSSESIVEIFDELGLNIDNYRETTFEDTHIQFDWTIPFDLKNEENEHVVTMAPFIAVGLWCPTGKTKRQNYAFSLPTGNDGHFGVTLEGSINFDFPRMVQLSFGAGASFYASKKLNDFRVPSNEYQSGIYPWRTKIKRDPGAVWYANASFKAPKFLMDDLSFFFDYIYTQHNKDEISLREEDPGRGVAFKPVQLEEESKWKSNIVHAGLNYQVTPGLQFGISFNSHISGVRVYKTTTILGTMNFIF